MTYILILVYYISGQTVQFQEFTSLQDCEAAKTVIEKSFVNEHSFDFVDTYKPKKMTCVFK
jgi:hypothetical protein